jgi:hypothetical protein
MYSLNYQKYMKNKNYKNIIRYILDLISDFFLTARVKKGIVNTSKENRHHLPFEEAAPNQLPAEEIIQGGTVRRKVNRSTL